MMKAAQRKHLAKSLLPDTAFRHIGVMVMFMAVLMIFSGFGFIAISGVISGWSHDIDNTLSIEIPAYHGVTQSIKTPEMMDNTATSFVKAIQYDPLVVSIDEYAQDDMRQRLSLQIPMAGVEGADDYAVPLPRFYTVRIHPDRAEGSINRLKKIIENVAPDIIVKTHEEWLKEINQTATILRMVFGGLVISILIVTGFIITGVVRTQLRASADTVTLFHLMGAQSYIIAGLFQRAVLSPVTKGAFIGLLIGLAALTPVTIYLDLNAYAGNVWLLAPMTLLLFMVLSAITTQLTVLSNLREMP